MTTSTVPMYACTHIYCTNLRAMGRQLLGLTQTVHVHTLRFFFYEYLAPVIQSIYSEKATEKERENLRTHTQLVYKAKHIA